MVYSNTATEWTDVTVISKSGTSTVPMWNYGKEVWCNLEGQYVTLVADLSALSALNPNYIVSICNFGVMGT